MKQFYLFLSLLDLILGMHISRRQTGGLRTGEYCMSESLRAQCARNEVIVMAHAQYGRMKLGRCVVADIGFLGCATDALPFLDSACSGRNKCDFLVPSADLDRSQKCMKELRSYLEVSYKCVKVAIADKAVCQASPSLKLLSTEGFLSSQVASEYTCGRPGTPWRLEVLPGQTINVTLMDYGYARPPGRDCVLLGYITNVRGTINRTICSSSERESQVFSHEGESVLVNMLMPRPNHHYMLHYQVSGCADLRAPQFAWYKREEDLAVVGCHHTDKSWHLRCRNNHWVGVLGNCTAKALATTEQDDSWIAVSHVFVIIVIISIALGIAIIVLACGFLCVNRSSAKKKKQAMLDQPLSEALCAKQLSHQSDKYATQSSRSTEYAHIWDAQLMDTTHGIRTTSGGVPLSVSGRPPPSDSDYGSQSYVSGLHWKSSGGESDCTKHGSLS